MLLRCFFDEFWLYVGVSFRGSLNRLLLLFLVGSKRCLRAVILSTLFGLYVNGSAREAGQF